MITLVQLLTENDLTIYINPQHVAMVEADLGDQTNPSTTIYLTSGEKVTVKYTLEGTVKKLTG